MLLISIHVILCQLHMHNSYIVGYTDDGYYRMELDRREYSRSTDFLNSAVLDSSEGILQGQLSS